MDSKFKELKRLIRRSHTETVRELKEYVNLQLTSQSVRIEELSEDLSADIQKVREDFKNEINRLGENLRSEMYELGEDLRDEMQEGYSGIAEILEKNRLDHQQRLNNHEQRISKLEQSAA